MNMCDVNPFIRYAGCIRYSSATTNNWVRVQDCRIIYILSGQADLFIQDLSYSLTPGSLFYCYEGNCYNLVSDNIECICLNFDLTQSNNMHTTFFPRISVENITSICDSSKVKECCTTEEDFITNHLVIPSAGEFLNDMNTILDEFSEQKIYFRETSSGILKMLLAHLYRHSLNTTDHSALAVNKVLEYIKGNFSKPLNNQLLSEIARYHENHLNRLFLEYTGITTHQYILTIRLNEAKRLLLNTDLPLITIAEMCGFNSNTYFSRYFKQTEGLSPSEYRKIFKNRI